MTDIYGGYTRRRLVGETWFWILVILATIAVIALASFGIRWVTASPKGQLAAREQIQSGSFRIAAYDHFFDLCAAVQAQEGALAAQYVEREGATGDNLQRINANIAGLSAQRASSIAQYNADARKDYTIGQFRSSGLPYQLPTDTYVKGQATSCAS